MSIFFQKIVLVNPSFNLPSAPVDIKSPDSKKDTISPRSWEITANKLCDMVYECEKDTISPRSWNKTADKLCDMVYDSDFDDNSKKSKAIKKSSLISKVTTKPNPKLSDYAKTRRRKGGRFVKEEEEEAGN